MIVNHKRLPSFASYEQSLSSLCRFCAEQSAPLTLTVQVQDGCVLGVSVYVPHEVETGAPEIRSIEVPPFIAPTVLHAYMYAAVGEMMRPEQAPIEFRVEMVGAEMEFDTGWTGVFLPIAVAADPPSDVSAKQSPAA
jgi:hypothetical protein